MMATSDPPETFEVDPDDVARAVTECGLFSSVSVMRWSIFGGVRRRPADHGQTLMIEGAAGGRAFIVRHGRLRATVVGPHGTDVLVGEIGKNEVVGEMAVITDQDRAATVRAMRDTDLFRLPAAAVRTTRPAPPAILRPFASVVVDRLRTAMTQPLRPSFRPRSCCSRSTTTIDGLRPDLAEHLRRL